MGYRRNVKSHVICALSLALAAMPAVAWAQLIANPFESGKPASGVAGSDGGAGNGNGNGGPTAIFPGGKVPAPTQNLTPQQMRSIMMYRALQSRGRGRVQRGVPQFIPFGRPAFFPYSQGTRVAEDRSADDAKSEARRQRLIEARKATEQKRRLAREARIAKAKAKAAAARQAKAAAALKTPTDGK